MSNTFFKINGVSVVPDKSKIEFMLVWDIPVNGSKPVTGFKLTYSLQECIESIGDIEREVYMCIQKLLGSSKEGALAKRRAESAFSTIRRGLSEKDRELCAEKEPKM
jgi:hypothetical protein